MSQPLGLEADVVRLVPYDPRWPGLFREEAERITALVSAAGLPLLTLEHVGSTAVPGLAAKPVLDLAAGRMGAVAAAHYVPVFEGAGYVYRGERGLPGREFFRRGSPRTHHVHLVERDGPHWQGFLRFRRILREVEEARQAYASLKDELARRHPRDREAYVEGKKAFIEEILGSYSVIVASTADGP